MALVRHYQAAQLSRQEPADETMLINMYKCFTLFPYYDKVPGSDLYSSLVSAGIYSNTPESIEKSNLTYTEMQNFGVALNVEGLAAYTWYFLNNGQPEKALEMSKQLLEVPKESLGDPDVLYLHISVCLALKDVRHAVKTFETIVSLEVEETEGTILGSTSWPRAEDILSQLLEASKEESDSLLHRRMVKAVKQSREAFGIGSNEQFASIE
jgi:hypothetical protein